MLDLANSITDTIFGLVGKLGTWPWLIIVIAVPVSLLVLHLHWWIRRGPAWERVARQLGFRYRNDDPGLPGKFRSFTSFQAQGSRCLNILSREAEGTSQWLLDHSSGTRSSKTQSSKARTACILRRNGVNLPGFRLIQRKPSLTRAPEVVVFKEDPEFSKKLVLYTDNPAPTTALFEHAVRGHFRQVLDSCRQLQRSGYRGPTGLMLRLTIPPSLFEVEAHADTLIVYIDGYLHPDSAPAFLRICEQTFLFLAARCARLTADYTQY